MIMKKKGFSSNGGVFNVCHFCHSALQSFKCVCVCVCVCVERGHTCVYTKLTFHLHHACTAFLSSPHPPSWLWLVGTTVQTVPGLHHITDTHQVHEYPDSTISKKYVKWRTITTFNRKLLEKQSVKNSFASYEVHSEYPDSTISKILTVLKSRMITTLNRKVLEKQKLQLLPTGYT